MEPQQQLAVLFDTSEPFATQLPPGDVVQAQLNYLLLALPVNRQLRRGREIRLLSRLAVQISAELVFDNEWSPSYFKKEDIDKLE